VLPVTRHRLTRPALTPASKLVLDFPTPEGMESLITGASGGKFFIFIGRILSQMIRLHRISAPAPANPKSGHFPQIRPSHLRPYFWRDLADASDVAVRSVNYGTDKSNKADVAIDVFAILISFTCNYSIVINKLPEANLVSSTFSY